MSLIPPFEIGVWNCWIFTTFFILYITTISLIFRDIGHKMDHGKEEQKKLTIASLFWLLLLLYSIFLPIKLWTAWFYAGSAFYLLGLVFLTLFFMNVAATPEGKPFIRGVYRYSRHPMYFGMFLQFLGVSIASASWLYLLLTLLMMFQMRSIVCIEERACLQKFGEPYREYMDRTPRWIGLLKSDKA